MISRETGAFDKITSPGCWLGVLPDIRSLTSDGFDQLGPRDVMVLRRNLTGIQHVPNYPWALDLAALQKG